MVKTVIGKFSAQQVENFKKAGKVAQAAQQKKLQKIANQKPAFGHGKFPFIVPDVDAIKPVKNNVFDYFTEKFDREPKDESFKELSLRDGCGRDCKKVIDAAAALLEIAVDPDEALRQKVVDVAEYQVEVFWRG